MVPVWSSTPPTPSLVASPLREYITPSSLSFAELPHLHTSYLHKHAGSPLDHPSAYKDTNLFAAAYSDSFPCATHANI
ncbi:MAG: hypothetical protein U9Q78_08305 [Chloroflexota bacterium]|nr:hypothetical protein [Chloroflexota bacterium]